MIHVLFTARCATGLNFLHWMSCYLVNRTPVILGKLTGLQVRKHHAVVETVHLLSHKTRVWLFDSFTENLILCLSVLSLLFLKQVKERQRKKQTMQPSPKALTEEQWPKTPATTAHGKPQLPGDHWNQESVLLETQCSD